MVLMMSSEQPVPNVWYSAEGVDITDKVIKAYDAHFADKAKEKK